VASIEEVKQGVFQSLEKARLASNALRVVSEELEAARDLLSHATAGSVVWDFTDALNSWQQALITIDDVQMVIAMGVDAAETRGNSM
jgi:hypothetical protein